MPVGCNSGIVVIYQKEVREIIAAHSVERMAFRMVELAFAAHLMGFLMAIPDNGDFAAQGVIHVGAADRKRDGLRLMGLGQPKSECCNQIAIQIEARDFRNFFGRTLVRYRKGRGQFSGQV